MKNLSRYLSLLVVAAFFATPFFAIAATAGECSLRGQQFNFTTQQCYTPGQLPSSVTNTPYVPSSSGVGVNLNAITPYSDLIINLINDVFVPVLFALAFLMFLWGVYKYFILGAADEEARAKGREFVLWGLIGFVVILSVWGLVAIVTNTFGLSAESAPAFPRL